MCIRDSFRPLRQERVGRGSPRRDGRGDGQGARPGRAGAGACLLYTSDAADERSSVDLGGRRIIKKKNNTTSN